MAKSIKKNYIYNLAFQILTIILPIVTMPYLARILGAEGVGISSYTLSIVAYFILFANLGVASFGQREIAIYQDNKEKYSKVFWNLMSYKMVLGVLSMSAYAVLVLSASKYQVIYNILVVNLAANIFDISWLFQGLEEYKAISIRNIIVKLFFTVSIFIFVRTPEDLNLYIALNSLSILFSTLILWVTVPKIISKPEIRKLNPFRYWKDTIIYFLPQVATTIYTVLDKTMLGLMTDNQLENGYYEQAYKIISVALTIITSLNVVLAPRMAFLYGKKNYDEIRRRLLKSLRFVSMLAVPIAIGIAVTASEIVPWFFGDGYEKVAILLPIFSPIVIAIGFSNCIGGQCLTPCGMRAKSAVALWIGAILNLVSNVILIPKLGSIGAAIGSLIAEFAIMLIYFWLGKKYVNAKELFYRSLAYIMSGAIMGAVILIAKQFLPTNMVYSIAEIGLGVVIYGVALLAFRDELLLDEIKNLKRKLARKHRQA